jgi:hypothetical protein
LGGAAYSGHATVGKTASSDQICARGTAVDNACFSFSLWLLAAPSRFHVVLCVPQRRTWTSLPTVWVVTEEQLIVSM